MSKITDAVMAIAGPVAERYGYEVWDVEYVKEAGGWFLRVYIDRREGITLADCESMSRELDPLLDENDELFPGSYTFEVSSAGAERQLRRPSDFERFLGHRVEVKLYRARDSRKEYVGTLTGYDGGVRIMAADSEMRFEKSEVANVRLTIG